MMKLIKDRRGFATNSSSSHSIVFVPDARQRLNENGADGWYQWNNFTLTSEEAKRGYLAICLMRTLQHLDTSEENIKKIVTRECGKAAYKLANDGGSIDHQSLLIFPGTFSEPKRVNLWFFREFRDRVLNEDVAILGGNDNSDGHWLHNQMEIPVDTLDLGIDTERWDDIVVRKNYWHNEDGEPERGFTCFNRENGSKQRYALQPGPQGVHPLEWRPKLQAPELVDLKITDYCPFGCSFCYQSSTQSGVHASLEHIKEVIDKLAEMQVFEVAIGGGEPTMHPDFPEILRYTRQKGIVPNFTTRSTAWISKHEITEAVREYTGGFAYSVHSADEVKKIRKLMQENELTAKQTFQIVMGTMPLNELRETLIAINDSGYWRTVTLLGFKEVGFGTQYSQEKHDYSNWVDMFLELRKEGNFWVSLGIDTALAAESVKALEEAKVEQWRYSVVEGDSSMYIDAVARVSGSCSYLPFNQMRRYIDVSMIPEVWMQQEIWKPREVDFDALQAEAEGVLF